MSRRWRIIIILSIGIALGALREFLFINLNYQIAFATHLHDLSYAHSAFQRWVGGWDAGMLFMAKWALALAFTLAMLSLCLALSRVLGLPRRSDRAIIVTFAAIAVVSIALHLSGPWLGQGAALDAVSVKLSHVLQYPVVLLFVWAAASLWREGASA